jgi:hypothetical protein
MYKLALVAHRIGVKSGLRRVEQILDNAVRLDIRLNLIIVFANVTTIFSHIRGVVKCLIDRRSYAHTDTSPLSTWVRHGVDLIIRAPHALDALLVTPNNDFVVGSSLLSNLVYHWNTDETWLCLYGLRILTFTLPIFCILLCHLHFEILLRSAEN